MQTGYVENSGAPLDGELELINQYTRRALSADEVYTFSVVLCDNETDRDFERFTIDALNTLAKLFVGKTGIFDHSMKGRDQVARIFSCAVEEVSDRCTADGQRYYRLKARAYMPRSRHNEHIMLEIDSGIKREVSVGCAVAESRCSICGKDRRKEGCVHTPGQHYCVKGRTLQAYTLLDKPTDAYEWSFVAVPAQPLAGVVKAFSRERQVKTVEEAKALKSLHAKGEVRLSEQEAKELLDYIDGLRSVQKTAQDTRRELIDAVVALYGAAQPELPAQVVKNAMAALDDRAVRAFYDAARKSFGVCPATPQLCSARRAEEKQSNANFMI